MRVTHRVLRCAFPVPGSGGAGGESPRERERAGSGWTSGSVLAAPSSLVRIRHWLKVKLALTSQTDTRAVPMGTGTPGSALVSCGVPSAEVQSSITHVTSADGSLEARLKGFWSAPRVGERLVTSKEGRGGGLEAVVGEEAGGSVESSLGLC